MSGTVKTTKTLSWLTANDGPNRTSTVSRDAARSFSEAGISCIAELRQRGLYVSALLANKERWFFLM